MTELRNRMDEAMLLRGFSPRTRESYLACVTALAKYYRQPPDLIDGPRIQAYLLHLITERKLAYATVNQASCAFRFLYCSVLRQPQMRLDIPMAKVPKRLPQILTRVEVSRLIDAAPTLRGRTLLATAYAAGLRLSELCALQLSDIQSDPERMYIKVRQGKGAQDRYTLLSPRLLEMLRGYWRTRRPRIWLFPNSSDSAPICTGTAHRTYYAARDAVGIAAEGGIHSLRHAFATHLIEAGVDLPTVQRLLGHGHISTTMRYVHLARSRVTGTTSPLELLDPPPQ
ncbi:MAG: site-specific integrase [Planctomycetota bacterium]